MRFAPLVGVGVDDGCNHHWIVSPAVAAPVIAVTRPETPAGSYNDVMTLTACFKGSGPRLRPASVRSRHP